MLGLHALTGFDSVGSFKGIGKLKALKLLLKSPTYCDTLRDLGDGCKVDDEKFICVVFGKAKFDSVNEERHLMLQSKYDGDISVKSLKSSAIDPVRFPPSKAYLKEHVAK